MWWLNTIFTQILSPIDDVLENDRSRPQSDWKKEFNFFLSVSGLWSQRTREKHKKDILNRIHIHRHVRPSGLKVIVNIYMSCRSYTLCRSYNFGNIFAEVTTSTAMFVEVITSTIFSVEVTTSTYIFVEVKLRQKKICRSYFT